MNNIMYVSWYTFIELVRNKVLYALLFFAFFIFALGIAITQMTIGNVIDIISDIGLGTIEMFSTAIAIFVGVLIVQRELSLKTLHPLLARPLSRTGYILGKFFGMILLILVEMLLMSLIFLAMLVSYGGAERFIVYLPAIFTIFLQTGMVISVSVLCSSLAEPAVAAAFSISYYLIGATSANLVYLLDGKASKLTMDIVKTFRYILPDFSYLNIKDNLVYGTGLEKISIPAATAYALASMAIILAVSVIIFNKKEIN